MSGENAISEEWVIANDEYVRPCAFPNQGLEGSPEDIESQLIAFWMPIVTTERDHDARGIACRSMALGCVHQL
jgi:hypothetical protein